MHRFILVMGLMASGCGTGHEAPEHDELSRHCGQMRDHLVDLRLADATGMDRKRHRELMRNVLDDDFVRNCSRTMTMKEIECVLGAASSESTTACHEPSHR
jgi:hypothetical protein